MTGSLVSRSLRNVADAAAVLHALGDPTRRAIFERLWSGPRSVAQIHEGMSVSRPAVSQHLKVLREAGLVTCRSEGTRQIYEVRPAGLDVLQAYLNAFWDSALAAFKEAAEAAAREAAARENEKGSKR